MLFEYARAWGQLSDQPHGKPIGGMLGDECNLRECACTICAVIR
jgi:hypothetical protein